MNKIAWTHTVLGKLGPGQLGPGAQLSASKKWQIGPRTTGPWGPTQLSQLSTPKKWQIGHQLDPEFFVDRTIFHFAPRPITHPIPMSHKIIGNAGKIYFLII